MRSCVMMQAPPSDNWLHWIYTNAPAAWISALIATISLLVVLRSRKKPRRIVVKELRNSSVVTIDESIRTRVAVKFDDKPVNSLAQVEIEMFNEGSEAIKEAPVKLTFPNGCRLLNASLSPAQANHRIKFADPHTIEMYLSHLNSFAQHKEVISVSVLADGKTTPIIAEGSGVDWSVRRTTLPAGKLSPNYINTLVPTMGLVLAVIGCVLIAVKAGAPSWLLWGGIAAVGAAMLRLGYIHNKLLR